MTLTKNEKRVRLACYMMAVSMSVVGNLSPLLFITFNSLYDVSFSLLGLLVLINFSTQLIVDLIFSFLSHKMNVHAAVKMTPVLCTLGLALFAIWPYFFAENVYTGLVLGTVIFSAASGFGEVLLSPVIAALPSENPDRDMSKLHSVYAWGVVFIILFSTAFLFVFGTDAWQILTLILALIPFTAAFVLFGAKLPTLETTGKGEGIISLMKKRELWLCVAAIFLGGACECIMAQWCSGYAEEALGIEKILGDIFGAALFGLMLALGRSLYAKYGRGIGKVLFTCGIGAAICYFVAALCPIPAIGLIACALTGLAASMLWPGSLISVSELIPTGGVFIFAFMAAGGDLGASVGPQLVGIITDAVGASEWGASLSDALGITADSLGMRIGILIGFIFAIISIPIYYSIMRKTKKEEKQDGA